MRSGQRILKECDNLKGAKSVIGNIIAILYFFSIMPFVIFILAFAPIGLLMDIKTIRASGFSTTNIGITLIGILGMFIAPTLLIPALRGMYYKLPWLFPFVKIFFIDLIILSIALAVLNLGYEVQNSTRHSMFFALMIIQIILCRAAMSIYFSRKPVEYIGGGLGNGK